MVGKNGGIVITSPYSDVTIRGGTIDMTNTTGGWPVIRLYGGVKDILIEDIDAWGDAAFLDVANLDEGTVENVILRNITYHGPTLMGGTTKTTIQGLVMENVELVP